MFRLQVIFSDPITVLNDAEDGTVRDRPTFISWSQLLRRRRIDTSFFFGCPPKMIDFS